MKAVIALIGCLFLAPSTWGQTNLTPAEWQADLRFLQQTVHDDYSFLFRKVTPEEFDAAVEKLEADIPKLQEHEIIAGITRLIAMFRYGHTGVHFRHGAANYNILPINLYIFSDGVYVQGAHRKYTEAVGAKLLRIGGVPVEDALEAIRPLVSAENDQFFKAHAPNYLCVPAALHAQGVIPDLRNSITLGLERDGKPFELTMDAIPGAGPPPEYGFASNEGDWVAARDDSKTPLYLKNLDRIYYFEYLPDLKTVYVRHSQIQDDPQEPIPAFYQRLFEFIEQNDVERLVIDVRLNGGGNNYKNKPVVTGILGCKKINQPGKLFVIIGRRTYSACQNLVNELDNYTNAIFVGEPTSENINFYGDNRTVELPNSKIPVSLSFAWWQDKPQWENADWLKPDIAVEMSFDDFRSNRDPVLDAVFSVPTVGVMADPLERLRALFDSGQLEQVQTEAAAMIEDPRYKFVDFERELNEAGYALMRGGKSEEALFVFRLNTDLFPTSANVWDSLGEWHWKSRDREKAIECYRKAAELDPEGSIGDNARNMLSQIGDAK